MKDFQIVCEICGRISNGHIKYDHPQDLGFRTGWTNFRHESKDAYNPLCSAICEGCAEELENMPVGKLDPVTPGYKLFTIQCDCGRAYEGQHIKGNINVLILPDAVEGHLPDKWQKQYLQEKRVSIEACQGCLTDYEWEYCCEDNRYGAGIKGKPETWKRFSCKDEAYEYAQELKGRSKKIEVLISYAGKDGYWTETFVAKRR